MDPVEIIMGFAFVSAVHLILVVALQAERPLIFHPTQVISLFYQNQHKDILRP
jgi:hypothetical protein